MLVQPSGIMYSSSWWYFIIQNETFGSDIGRAYLFYEKAERQLCREANVNSLLVYKLFCPYKLKSDVCHKAALIILYSFINYLIHIS